MRYTIWDLLLLISTIKYIINQLPKCAPINVKLKQLKESPGKEKCLRYMVELAYKK